MDIVNHLQLIWWLNKREFNSGVILRIALGETMRNPQSAELMKQAMMLLEQALALLDQAEAPGDIGAHVDLALDRLGNALDRPGAAGPVVWATFSKPAA
jgi:hypothetical protein